MKRFTAVKKSQNELSSIFSAGFTQPAVMRTAALLSRLLPALSKATTLTVYVPSSSLLELEIF